MILQMRAHAGQIVQHLDALFAQMRRRADPRQHQQLRRVDRPAAQHHLAPGLKHAPLPRLLDLEAAGPAPVEQDAPRQRVGQHRQIGAFEHRMRKARALDSRVPRRWLRS
jgi:hypothetical protein